MHFATFAATLAACYFNEAQQLQAMNLPAMATDAHRAAAKWYAAARLALGVDADDPRNP